MSILEYTKMTDVIQSSSCADTNPILKHANIDYHITIPMHDLANKVHALLPPVVQYSFEEAMEDGWIIAHGLCKEGQENRLMSVILAAGLITECERGNYKLIEKIYELCPIDRERIIAYSQSRRSLTLPAADAYYNDYLQVLREELEEDEEQAKAILRVINRSAITKDNKFLNFIQNPDSICSGKHLKGVSAAEENVIQYYVMLSWARSMTIDNFNDYESDPKSIHFAEGDSVLDSKQYQRFTEKRIEELAEYLRELYGDSTITTENVCEKIAPKITLLRRARLGETFHKVDPQKISYKIFTSVLLEHFGDAKWLRLSLKQEGEPDVQRYLNDYFLQHIKTVCEGGKTTKVTFMRENVPTPAEIYQGIILLYHSDMYMRLYGKLQEKYYREFSWEQITHKSLAERYADYIKELNAELSEKDDEISSLKKRNLDLSDANRLLSVKGGSVDFHELEEIAQRKDKEIEAQNKRIAELERKLKQSETMLTKLQTEEPETEDAPIDFNLLKSKRYLFVGKINESHPEMKREFPSSLFFDNEGYDLKNIEVDAIVIFIRHTSHAMFYKLQNETRLAKMPRVYINTKNINTVYNEMQLALEGQ